MPRLFAPAGVAVGMGTAIVCLTLGAHVARAQRSTSAELGLDATHIVLDGYLGAAAGTLSGAVASDGNMWHVQGVAATSLFETGHTAAYGTMAATLDFLSTSTWRASWSGDVGSGAFRGDVSGRYIRTTGRVAYTQSMASAWVLGSVGEVHDVGTNTSQRGEAGVGILYRSLTATASVDRAKVADFTYNDAEAHASWDWNRLAFAVNAGNRFGANIPGRTVWGNGQATLDLSNTLRVVATGGSEPADPERASLGAAFVSLGIRLHATHDTRTSLTQGQPESSPANVIRVSGVQADGSRIIVLRLDHGNQVELMGDFTDWESTPMRQTSAHVWTLTVPISVGAHRLNIRVDGGEWQVPPGMPALPDDFGGMAGVIAVE